MKKSKSFFLTESNYCDGRMLDYQHIYNYLIINDWRPVRQVWRADLVIVGTCALTCSQEEKALNYIKYCLKKKRKNALIIITGCISRVCPEKLKEIGVFISIPVSELKRIDEYINPRISFCQVADPNTVVPSQVLYEESSLALFIVRKHLSSFFFEFSLNWSFVRKFLSKLRELFIYVVFSKPRINPFIERGSGKYFYLRISDGCLGNCSYCGMKFSTGTLTSKRPELVLSEFCKGLELRYNLFFITGEDTGCYGLDIGSDFIYLLKEILSMGRRKDFKLMISNFNAQWFVKYYQDLKKIFLESKDKIGYLQIPIQSGSDIILAAMNRPYRIGEVVDCLIDIKKFAPSLRIATDIMVGFPGENEYDFEKTRSLLKMVNFDFADIFVYEDRPRTVASGMMEKVAYKDICGRRASLLKIQNSKFGPSIFIKKGLMVIKKFL